MLTEPSYFIQTQFNDLISKPDDGFDTIFRLLNQSDKECNRNILIYIDKIINYHFNHESDKLKYLHLQFPLLPQETKNAIIEFLSVKLFLRAIKEKKANDINPNVDCYAKKKFNSLIEKKKMPIMIKEGERGQNKRFQKNLVNYKQDRNESITFWQNLGDIGNIKEEYLVANTLLVLSKSRNSEISETFFKNYQFASNIEDQKNRDCNIVLLNHKIDLKKLTESKEKPLMNNLKNIVIVHSHKSEVQTDFNFNALLRLKNQKKASFQNLILVSFARDKKTPFRLGKAIDRDKAMTSKYRLPDKSKKSGIDYWVHPVEIGGKIQNVPVVFKGNSTNNFFTEIYEFIKEYDYDRELQELVSRPMFNIYSLCCSQRFKEIVMDDIFNEQITEPTLIHKNSKEALLRLKKVGKFPYFKKNFENFLSKIQGDWISLFGELNMTNVNNKATTFVISNKILKNDALKSELAGKLIGANPHFTSWLNIFEDDCQTDNIIFLAYRDCGKYFDNYPNLFEIPPSQKNCKGVFLKFMFENRYYQTKCSYENKFLKNCMNVPFRQEKMNWNRLQVTKPEKNIEDTIFDLESNYSSESETKSVNIKGKAYYPSQRFLIQLVEDKSYLVLSAATLFDEYIGQSKFYGLLLSDIIDQLHSFEFKGKNLEDELKQIEDFYNLSTVEKKGQLWRVLLKRKEAEGVTVQEMYETISDIAIENRAVMVSADHFKNSWLNLEDKNLIPRSKALFKSITAYLDLPKPYIQVMLRKRATERNASRKNTNNSNDLIERIVELGLLNDDITVDNSLFDRIIGEQELADYGFSTEYLFEYSRWMKNYFLIHKQSF